ncbi:MAG: nucleoside triphosphate pyrophosphohydrolase [Chitinophagaceae bacterium]|jgi:XTP/dITP diphosphohydrolase
MEPNFSFNRLQEILDDLREKCPWDKKQTIHSLRQLTIEETYELADAIAADDWKGIKEELGDLLLHILFYAKIATEQNQFTIQDVIEANREKLIHRHPHIYGDVKVADEEEVKRNWEKLKLKEGKKSILSGVPRSLAPLVQAMRIQEKAKQVGFEWEHKEQVWEKVEEESNELKEEVVLMDAGKGSQERMEEELGDLLFSIVNYARFLNIDPDQALARTNKKFINRFQAMEEVVAKQGKQMTDLNLTEMDAIWNEIKLSSRD